MSKTFTEIKSAFIDTIGDALGTSKFAKDRKFIQKATGLEINREDYQTYRSTPYGQRKTVTERFGGHYYDLMAELFGKTEPGIGILSYLQDQNVKLSEERMYICMWDGLQDKKKNAHTPA